MWLSNFKETTTHHSRFWRFPNTDKAHKDQKLWRDLKTDDRRKKLLPTLPHLNDILLFTQPMRNLCVRTSERRWSMPACPLIHKPASLSIGQVCPTPRTLMLSGNIKNNLSEISISRRIRRI